MTPEELKENLCVYDRNSPHYQDEAATGIFVEEGECCCDFCFSGKSKIAEYALDLQAELTQLKSNLRTVHSMSDLRELRGDI